MSPGILGKKSATSVISQVLDQGSSQKHVVI